MYTDLTVKCVLQEKGTETGKAGTTLETLQLADKEHSV